MHSFLLRLHSSVFRSMDFGSYQSSSSHYTSPPPPPPPQTPTASHSTRASISCGGGASSFFSNSPVGSPVQRPQHSQTGSRTIFNALFRQDSGNNLLPHGPEPSSPASLASANPRSVVSLIESEARGSLNAYISSISSPLSFSSSAAAAPPPHAGARDSRTGSICYSGGACPTPRNSSGSGGAYAGTAGGMLKPIDFGVSPRILTAFCQLLYYSGQESSDPIFSMEILLDMLLLFNRFQMDWQFACERRLGSWLKELVRTTECKSGQKRVLQNEPTISLVIRTIEVVRQLKGSLELIHDCLQILQFNPLTDKQLQRLDKPTSDFLLKKMFERFLLLERALDLDDERLPAP